MSANCVISEDALLGGTAKCEESVLVWLLVFGNVQVQCGTRSNLVLNGVVGRTFRAAKTSEGAVEKHLPTRHGLKRVASSGREARAVFLFFQ